MTRSFKPFLFFLAFLFAVFFCSGKTRFSVAASEDFATVRRVVDGDTFVLEGGEWIRLIGIDAPEYQPKKKHIDFFGREALEYARRLLTGKKIRLEKDIDPTDDYGRTLAYVYLEDGRFVNLLLVQAGYAKVKYYSPNGRHYLELKQSQDKARRSKKGLWTRI